MRATTKSEVFAWWVRYEIEKLPNLYFENGPHADMHTAEEHLRDISTFENVTRASVVYDKSRAPRKHW